MKPGRKSAAELEVSVVKLASTGKRSKPTVPSTLSTSEQEIFLQVLRQNPHLDADEPLLALYAQALAKAQKLAKGKDVAAWEKAARVAVVLATKLRATQMSAIDPVALGRRKADHRPGPVPWARDENDDGESDVSEGGAS
jgi:hypothetical protein